MYKTIHHHARGTLTAAKHGYGRTGCYTVETRAIGRPLRVEAAFIDAESAREHLAKTLGMICRYYKAAHGIKSNGPSWLND